MNKRESEEWYGDELQDQILELNDRRSINFKGASYSEIVQDGIKKSHSKSL
jgi:hypothetical protein